MIIETEEDLIKKIKILEENLLFDINIETFNDTLNFFKSIGFKKGDWDIKYYVDYNYMFISKNEIHVKKYGDYKDTVINIENLVYKKEVNVEFTDKGWHYE